MALLIDVRNPSSPYVAQALMQDFAPRTFSDLWVDGGFAYGLASWDRRYRLDGADHDLTVMNVEDPADPREVGSYPVSGSVVEVQGGLALLSGDSFWELLDVANPVAPTLLHHEDTPDQGLGRGRIAGDRGYLLLFSRPPPEYGLRSQLQIVDLTNPSAPHALGACTLTNEVEASGFRVAGNYVYLVQYSGLTVVDATNPADPRVVSTLMRDSCGALEVKGNHVYIVRDKVWDDENEAYRGRLWVVDVTDPVHPVTAGTWDAPWGVYLEGVRLADRYALVGSYEPSSYSVRGLEVIDVSNPGKPTWVGSYGRTIEGGTGFQVLGDRVYLSEWGGLTILDMSLPGVLKLNPPVLSANTLTLSWNGGPGIKLQKTSSLTNPTWQDVPGSDGVSNIGLPRDAAAAFFRLIQP